MEDRLCEGGLGHWRMSWRNLPPMAPWEGVLGRVRQSVWSQGRRSGGKLQCYRKSVAGAEGSMAWRLLEGWQGKVESEALLLAG